jgi:hypothetical protein
MVTKRISEQDLRRFERDLILPWNLADEIVA